MATSTGSLRMAVTRDDLVSGRSSPADALVSGRSSPADALVSGRSSPADALVGGRSSPADSLQVADAGRASRIRSLVDEHVDFIWRSLRRLGVLEADLADAAQQVFLVAARKLDLVQAGKERAFLFQTAIRVASDSRRTLRRRREVSDEVLVGQADDAPGPDDYAEARMRRAQLDRILDALPIELRAVFVLSQIEELTMAEIAALTDTPPGTVASRLRRARELFRQEALRAYERESGGGA